MKNKVVLVTGATGGLGTAVTQAFLDSGATIIGTSPKIQQADFKGDRFTAIPAELSNFQNAQELIAKILRKFGRLDVLAHTVGGFAGGQSIADTDEDTLRRMFDVNFNATFYMFRAALPALRKSGSGRIIAIGSRAAVDPGAGVGAYSASKAAMVSLVRTVATENRDAGVTANVILPGTIDTPANRKAMPDADFSRWVQPLNIAALMVWLAGDAAKDVNGALIPVYGDQ